MSVPERNRKSRFWHSYIFFIQMRKLVTFPDLEKTRVLGYILA